MPQHAQDSFDAVPAQTARQGTHRAPVAPRSGWFTFGWAALATGVLVGLGLLGLFAINNGIQFTDVIRPPGAAQPEPTPEPSIEPITDPSLSVTVLNGTDVTGLATRVGEAMREEGWSVGTFSNASDNTVEVTTVYFGNPAHEAAALGLAQALGGVPIELSADFPGADLTVVLGADHPEAAGADI